MADTRYLIQVYPSRGAGRWGFVVLRCSTRGARRVASADARSRLAAWAKACWCVAVIRYRERHDHASPVRHPHQ